VTEQPPERGRTRAEFIRDLIMLVILVFWAGYGALSVFQIFRDGSKVLDTLPPFWFWGIPLAPFSALYAPWGSAIKSLQGQPPEPPAAPDPPGGPQ
jgi:hypothetical protein